MVNKPLLIILLVTTLFGSWYPTNDSFESLDLRGQQNRSLPTLSDEVPKAGVYDRGVVLGGSARLTFRTPGGHLYDLLAPGCMVSSVTGGHGGRACIEAMDGQLVRPQPGGNDEVVYEPVDLKQVANQAVANTKPKPLQLHVQPKRGWVYTKVPTIVYFTGEPSEQVIEVDGLNAVVVWKPKSHEINFQDPSGLRSTITTSSMGAPYPDQTITWSYLKPGTAQPQALTTWDATVYIANAAYPFPNAHTTTATLSPIEVRQPKFSLTTPDYKPNKNR